METALAFAKAHFLDGWNHYLSTGAPEQVQNAHNMLQGRSSVQDLTQTWLALALDCGIAWIKRFPSILVEETANGWSWGNVTENSSFSANRNMFEAAAIDFLALMGMNADNTPDFTRGYLDSIVKFFECLLDSRLKILMRQPRRLSMGSSDW